jgi:hypothetical protein
MRKIALCSIMLFLVLFTLACGSKVTSGTLTATSINVGTSYPETISAYGTSFYSFTPSSTGSYTVSLTGITPVTTGSPNISWELFVYVSDSIDDYYSYTPVTECNPTHTASATEVVSGISLTAGTKYLLWIDEWNSVAANYSLIVTIP